MSMIRVCIGVYKITHTTIDTQINKKMLVNTRVKG